MPHSGHLLPVKGMLAREHTELILALEVFQTDCTGLLRGEGGVLRGDWRRPTLTHQLTPTQEH